MQKIYKLKHSQNFLRSPATSERLVEQMSLSADDVVVEIGPGTGQLTRHILPRVRTVVAVEKDANLAHKLVSKYPRLVCVNSDFLDYPLPCSNFKVIGNIPFAHTAEILRKLIKHQSPPCESYLIMQQEAAAKITGQPQETLQSLLLKPLFTVEQLSKIPSYEFVPIPKVNAALVKIGRKSQPELNNAEYEHYTSFITDIFTGFYPHVFAALKQKYGYSKMKLIQKILKTDLRVPRGELSYHQWLVIFRHLRL